MSIEIARMVVFLRECKPEPQGPEGPILYTEGSFKTEADQVGACDAGDLSFDRQTEFRGLVVFEGWIEVGHGEDPDVTFVGDWRKLDHWEMCRVRDGLTPWTSPPWENTELAKIAREEQEL